MHALFSHSIILFRIFPGILSGHSFHASIVSDISSDFLLCGIRSGFLAPVSGKAVPTAIAHSMRFGAGGAHWDPEIDIGSTVRVGVRLGGSGEEEKEEEQEEGRDH